MAIPPFPSSAPTAKPLKIILFAILLCVLIGPLLQRLGFPMQFYLGLSKPGLAAGFVWTVLTYPFTYPALGLLDLIMRLGLDLVLLWVFGRFLIERIGSKRFCILFFGATFAAGLSAAAGLFLLRAVFFCGPSPALLALFTAWYLLYAGQTSHTFKPIWIFLVLVIGNLALDAISRSWILLIADLTGVLFSYFFCLIVEKMHSPFASLYPFEQWIFRTVEKTHHTKKPTASKIIDFKTGEPVLDDDQFMDAMLARISLYGEEILTPEEKKRMQKISEQKKGS